VIELNQLGNRLAHLDRHNISPQARAKLLEMVRGHAAAFEREWDELRRELQPVFLSGEPENRADLKVKINNDADVARDIQTLHKLVLGVVNGIRNAFTTSSDSTDLSIESRQFWTSLIDAKHLATGITNYDR
jgi:hypothetical protein